MRIIRPPYADGADLEVLLFEVYHGDGSAARDLGQLAVPRFDLAQCEDGSGQAGLHGLVGFGLSLCLPYGCFGLAIGSDGCGLGFNRRSFAISLCGVGHVDGGLDLGVIVGETFRRPDVQDGDAPGLELFLHGLGQGDEHFLLVETGIVDLHTTELPRKEAHDEPSYVLVHHFGEGSAGVPVEECGRVLLSYGSGDGYPSSEVDGLDGLDRNRLVARGRPGTGHLGPLTRNGGPVDLDHTGRGNPLVVPVRPTGVHLPLGQADPLGRDTGLLEELDTRELALVAQRVALERDHERSLVGTDFLEELLLVGPGAADAGQAHHRQE